MAISETTSEITTLDRNLVRRPPHAINSNVASRMQKVSTFGAAATAAQRVYLEDYFSGSAVMIARFSADCCIVFGERENMEVATVDGFPILAGESWEWTLLGELDSFFSLIRTGDNDATCTWYLCDLLRPFPQGWLNPGAG
jgi:hypothetical protein